MNVLRIAIYTIVMHSVALLLSTSAQATDDFERKRRTYIVNINPDPIFELDASYQPNVGLEDSEGEADLARVDLRLGKLVGVNEDFAISAGFLLGLRNYRFDRTNNLGENLDENLYKITVELGAHWFPTDRIMLSAFFVPGLFSDLDSSLENDDWQWQGHTLGIYQLNKKWFLKLGFAVGEDFDETKVIPLAGFAWIPHDQLRIDVLLPRSAKLTWQPLEKRSLLIIPGMYLEGQQYHVDVGNTEADIQIQDIRADVTASYRVAPGSRVTLSVGSNFRGKYEVERAGGIDTDADQDPSLYIAIGFGSYF